MTRKIIFTYLFLTLSISNSNAVDITVPDKHSFLGDLSESLNITQVQMCELKYSKICPISTSIEDATLEQLYNQSLCIEPKMKIDKKCSQAYTIRNKTTGFAAADFKQYPKGIVVFTTYYPADGKTGYNMVDSTGKMFTLTIDNKLVSSNITYQHLKKTHPELSLWYNQSEDKFPEVKNIDNNKIMLIFDQDLNDPPIASGATVAIAKVGYIFDEYGRISSVKILVIESK